LHAFKASCLTGQLTLHFSTSPELAEYLTVVDHSPYFIQDFRHILLSYQCVAQFAALYNFGANLRASMDLAVNIVTEVTQFFLY
jgi:hypothetical protein